MRIFDSVELNHINLLRPLAPLHGVIDICVRELFCTKFNFEQLLFEAFLILMRILDSVYPIGTYTISNRNK